MASAYYLWLKPSDDAGNRLSRAIHELAHEHRAPVFEPHITVVGELAGTESQHRVRCEQLAQDLQPVPIVLGPAGHDDDYFRCVFLAVDQTHPVVDARMRASVLFDRRATPYFPHLSLLYGTYPESQRIEIIRQLSPELFDDFEATALSLIRADSRNPRDWHELGSYPLQA